jgi:chemotaxis protein histidine kinase CheA
VEAQTAELTEKLQQAEAEKIETEDKTARVIEWVKQARAELEASNGGGDPAQIEAAEEARRAAERLASSAQDEVLELQTQIQELEGKLRDAELQAIANAKPAAPPQPAFGDPSEAEARAARAEAENQMLNDKIATLIQKVKAEREEQQGQVADALEQAAQAKRALDAARSATTSAPAQTSGGASQEELDDLRAQIEMLKLDNETLRTQAAGGGGGDGGPPEPPMPPMDGGGGGPPPPPPPGPPPPAVKTSTKLNIVKGSGPRPSDAPAAPDGRADLLAAISGGVTLKSVSKDAINTAGQKKANPTPSRPGGAPGGFDFGSIAMMASDLSKKRAQRVQGGAPKMSAQQRGQARKSMALTSLMEELDT